MGTRRPGGKWQWWRPLPHPHTSPCSYPCRGPRRALPQPPGLRSPLCARRERRSEAAPGRRGERGRLSPCAGVVGASGAAVSNARSWCRWHSFPRPRLPRSRERLISGLDLPAAERAKPLLRFFPFPQLLTPKRKIPGRAEPDHLCLLPTALILRAREAPAPRRRLAKGSGKGGWMGPRGGVAMRGM